MNARSWPFRHLGLKVLSVGLAVLLWMVVAGEETVERGLRVPLELQQFPAGLELQGEAPSLVDVRVRGASGDAQPRRPGRHRRGARPAHGASGRRLFQLTPEQVRVPFGVQVVQVTPPSVALVFENSATRQVPVVPAVEGEPAPGYVVGKMTVEPQTVEVIGPESAVERVTEALTEPVSVAGARAGGHRDGHRRLARSVASAEDAAAGDRDGADRAGAASSGCCATARCTSATSARALDAQALPAQVGRRAARQPRGARPRRAATTSIAYRRSCRPWPGRVHADGARRRVRATRASPASIPRPCRCELPVAKH